jgi:nucleoside-diphosphate-sugar epimerase
MNILLTGATGFLGGAILKAAQKRGMEIRPVLRSQEQARRFDDAGNFAVIVPGLGSDTDWSNALLGVGVVVHCAAQVHVMQDTKSNPLMGFRAVNVEGTLNFARQAAAAKVKRFLFVSSIKVNGEATLPGRAYSADDAPAPEDAYGISKAEAEAGLRLLSHETDMEVVIVRPPLVYGPGVKGNFSSLLRWVSSGLPLPLGAATTNRRSLVALDNLVDLILTCVDHPKAANQTFLVSDGEDLSTAELFRRIAKALNQPAHLFPVPVSFLAITSSLFGKKAIAQRVLGSLQVDISKTCTVLGWKPPVSVDEGLSKAVGKKF